MKPSKQELYERIMKKVAPIVKQAINEKFNSAKALPDRRSNKFRALSEARKAKTKTFVIPEFLEKGITNWEKFNKYFTINNIDEVIINGSEAIWFKEPYNTEASKGYGDELYLEIFEDFDVTLHYVGSSTNMPYEDYIGDPDECSNFDDVIDLILEYFGFNEEDE